MLGNVVNVASVPQRSLFRYPGGKTWFIPTLRQWTKSFDEKPKILVEPFAGGGIIGLTAAFENLAEKVILVELDSDVAAVWKIVLSKDASKLASKILNYSFTRSSVMKTLEAKPKNTLEHAFLTILRNRVCHSGILAAGSGLVKNGENGKGLSSRWYPETLAKRISDIVVVQHKISFIHGSAFDVIPEYTSRKDVAIFVDPPYTAGGKKAGRRLYTHHAIDHDFLFSLFKKIKAEFLFTYDQSDELENMARMNGFKTALIAMKNSHHSKMEELIISNSVSWLSTQ